MNSSETSSDVGGHPSYDVDDSAMRTVGVLSSMPLIHNQADSSTNPERSQLVDEMDSTTQNLQIMTAPLPEINQTTASIKNVELNNQTLTCDSSMVTPFTLIQQQRHHGFSDCDNHCDTATIPKIQFPNQMPQKTPRKYPPQLKKNRTSANTFSVEEKYNKLAAQISDISNIFSSLSFSSQVDGQGATAKLNDQLLQIDCNIQKLSSNRLLKNKNAYGYDSDLLKLVSNELQILDCQISERIATLRKRLHSDETNFMEGNGRSQITKDRKLLDKADNILQEFRELSVKLNDTLKSEVNSTTKKNTVSTETVQVEKNVPSGGKTHGVPKRKAKRGKKELSLLRKTLDPQNLNVTTQFLRNQPDAQKDFNQTITVTGTVLDIALEVVSDDGFTPNKEETETSSIALTHETLKGLSNCGSLDALISVFPTMTQPIIMNGSKSKFNESTESFRSSFPSIVPREEGRKGGKKRRRSDNKDFSSNNKDDDNPSILRIKKKSRSIKSHSDSSYVREDESHKSSKNKKERSMGSSGREKAEQISFVRVLPDLTPKPKLAIIDGDNNPQRVCNPLLTLPQFPNSNDPPFEEIPIGGELWNIANLHFADPDTYPISYLARILGFDVPELGTGLPFAEVFDPMTVPTCKSQDEPWMSVPDAGSFFNRIWKKGRARSDGKSLYNVNNADDDVFLSHPDPLWMHILSSYRGFNENDFNAAARGFQSFISPQVLKYAEERGILVKNKFSFRFATLEDEQILLSLEEKSEFQSSPKKSVATCLRTQANFCIIAQSIDGTALAFIQYRFCWYKVEEKKTGNALMTSYGVKSRSGEAVDKISELVFFIDNLVCVDNSGFIGSNGGSSNHELNDIAIPQNDAEIVKILLTSLTLVHAWSVDIWYGMMESPPTEVYFFTNFFRMTEVGNLGLSIDVNRKRIPLACDLKKCSYRYAIHLFEESLKSCRVTESFTAVKDFSQYRMLVTLCDETTFSSEPTQHTIVDGEECGVAHFSSANSESKSKEIRMRVASTRFSDSSSIETPSISTIHDHEIIKPVNFSEVSDSASWNIIKFFPLQEEEIDAVNDICMGFKENVVSKGKSSSHNDFILEEMKKMQIELRTLETSIEESSRYILTEVYKERIDYELGHRKTKRDLDKKVLKDFEAVKQRLHEADVAWQAQLEQDMDAVCDVCWDGEVTPENQIIFCDSCNVAVHQGCYGIDKVPSGNYFCHPCMHYGKDKEYLAAERREGVRSISTRIPIVCELCPRRQGAFAQVDTPVSSKKTKWVHVSCAKWQGMKYVDQVLKDKIEDLTKLKLEYKDLGYICSLCKSDIGAFNKCRVPECENWLHLTCARSVGTCSVQHGENCEGAYDEASIPFAPWTLACRVHSDINLESIRKNSISVEQLVTIAMSYPPEPLPQKPFTKMTGKERREYWSDAYNLAEFVKKVSRNKSGAPCMVCSEPQVDMRCGSCGIFFHSSCVGGEGVCFGCQHTAHRAGSSDYKKPKCHMCNQSRGPLVKAAAKPVSMKAWVGKANQFKRSLFGPDNFCHALCGFWNPQCVTSVGDGCPTVDCSNIIMRDGKSYVSHQYRCLLCGNFNGAKVDCKVTNCRAPNCEKEPVKVHVTCAYEAGFEVSDDLTLNCFKHSGGQSVFRARLEDLMELEIGRSPDKTLSKGHYPMSWDHAASLFHSAVTVLRVLGWAWRWAEWWVENGDNWEPFIEPDQNEEEMTEEELKIVTSTPVSRCSDARLCRLAAFGAALRNRDYDKEEGDDQEPLERALKAVLSTQSLVGPLKKKEIDFFVTWLALAYRSKCASLGFGENKIPVANNGFCVHMADSSPKYELGDRPLPGKNGSMLIKGVFEPIVNEVDDFLPTGDVSKE